MNMEHSQKSQKNILQAVVLASHEEENFYPLTLNTPKALLPLANVPLIDYTLEMLKSSHVTEVFLTAKTSIAKKLEAYIESSPWNGRNDFSIKVVYEENSNEPCDTLRLLEKMDLIQSDPFILVGSMLVTNIDISEAIDIQKILSKTDRHNFITCVMKNVTKNHHHYPSGKNKTVMVTTKLDPRNKISLKKRDNVRRLLKYQLNTESLNEKEMSISNILNVSNGVSEFEVSRGFIDPLLDICSLDTLKLCIDNFDYRDLREHLLKSCIESEIEGLKAHIYCDQKGYLGAVRNFRSYDFISNDFLNKWCYPLSPCNQLFHPPSIDCGSYYKDESTVISKTSKLTKSSFLGANVVIESDAVIENSVLANGSWVGAGTKLNRVHTLENCRIGDDCVIEFCFLGKNVSVEDGSVLKKGIIVGDGTHLMKRECELLKPLSLVTENGSIKSEQMHPKPKISRIESFENSLAYACKMDKPFQKEMEKWSLESKTQKDIKIGKTPSPLKSPDLQKPQKPQSEEDKKAEKESYPFDYFAGSQKFIVETKKILDSAIKNKTSVEMASIEITSLKLSSNIDNVQTYFEGVLFSLLSNVTPQPEKKEGISPLKKTTLKSLERILCCWDKLFRSTCTCEDDLEKFLEALLKVCEIKETPFSSFFTHSLRIFYDKEILNEESILTWWEKIKVSQEKEGRDVNEGEKEILSSTEIFIQWLQNEEYSSE